jgi:hypothetical protein
LKNVGTANNLATLASAIALLIGKDITPKVMSGL